MSDKLPIVYVGPTSSKLGLVQYSQYIELNPYIQAALIEHPALNVLFIPLEQLGTRAPSIYAGRDAIITHAIKRLVKEGIF